MGEKMTSQDDLSPHEKAYLEKYGRIPKPNEKGFQRRMQRKFFDSADYNMQLAGIRDMDDAVGQPTTISLLNEKTESQHQPSDMEFMAKYGRLPPASSHHRQQRYHFDSADYVMGGDLLRAPPVAPVVEVTKQSTSALVNMKTLTEEEQMFVEKYGRLPPSHRGETLVQQQQRQYWDSADYGLELAGVVRPQPTSAPASKEPAYPVTMHLNEKMLTGEEREFLRKYGRLPNETSRSQTRKYFDSADYMLHMQGVHPSVLHAGGRPLLGPHPYGPSNVPPKSDNANNAPSANRKAPDVHNQRPLYPHTGATPARVRV